MADKILDAFKLRVTEYYRQRGIKVRNWPPGGTRNLIEIMTSTDSTLLYVKVSSLLDDVFWGLNPTQMNAMENSGKNWFVILLDGSFDRGYALTENDVNENRHRWYIEVQNRNYKVHKKYLSANMRFTSFSGLIYRIGK